MFARRHTLIALLSVALHLLDLVVAAGHQHVHLPGETCATACGSHEHAANHQHASHEHAPHGHGCGGHRHAHSHSHCHSHAKACDSHHCNPPESHPASKPHHDCAICQHLALTPALVSPASPLISPTGSSPVHCEVDSLLPPLRIVECRSRAPPILLA